MMPVTKSRKAIIFGTGSFAEVVDFYLQRDSVWQVVAFSVTADFLREPQFAGRPVVALEKLAEQYPPGQHDAFVAVGYRGLNGAREEFCCKLRAAGYKLLTYCNSRATQWGEVTFGDNVFIFEDNTVQPFTAIGDGTILWSGNHVGHHSTVGPYCFVSSHVVISGHCRIGANCFLGVNSTIADGVHIGDRNIIGPATLIQKSTGNDEAYFAERTARHPKPSSWFMK